MKIGDRVETKEGKGVIVEEFREAIGNLKWWYVKLDKQQKNEAPWHFLEVEMKKIK